MVWLGLIFKAGALAASQGQPTRFAPAIAWLSGIFSVGLVPTLTRSACIQLNG